jgi:23S rRNA (cytidine1920-2'-O)/16S rRNA (cytidine1409-2'-O)-methyltransferase
VCDFAHTHIERQRWCGVAHLGSGRTGGRYFLKTMARRRADTLLAERGLASSRSAAATSIRAGLVRVGTGGERVAKPGQLVPDSAELSVEQGRRFVSRGGNKLEAALDELAVDPSGLDCLDVGASTGGFTDCLLRRGAARVIALDVGRGQLDWGLRNDPRVTPIEGFNARDLAPVDLPWAPALATIDVSFISLRLILGPVATALAEGGEVLAMVKPQFELGPERVGGGGVVRERSDRLEAVRAVAEAAGSRGLGLLGAAPAGLPGPKGNREVFLHLGLTAPATDETEAILEGAVR